jgi:hypothetical protein
VAAWRRQHPESQEPFSRPRPAHSLARSLHRLVSMAAVDVSRVVALTNKAETLMGRGHFARAAENFAEAVTAAQALHQPDCVIVASLQASHADAVLGHADMAGVPEARRMELRRSALHELLPPAMASLERRMAAGTLLAGACRPYEVAWSAARLAHAGALAAANEPQNAAVRVPPTAEDMSAWSAYVGYDAYVLAAATALELCALATDLLCARALNLLSEARSHCGCVQRVCGARLRHYPAARGGYQHA